jgi:hypothetical protein
MKGDECVCHTAPQHADSPHSLKATLSEKAVPLFPPVIPQVNNG